MAIGWSELAYAAGSNAVVCAIVFFGFNYLRRLRFLSDFYSPKRKLSIPFRFRPPRLPSTWFTWMRPVFTIKPEKFAACAGYDALIYVEFLKLGLRMTVVIGLIAFVVALPTNLTGDWVQLQLDRQQPADAQGAAGADTDDALAAAASGEGTTFVATDFDKTALTNIRPCGDGPQESDSQCKRMGAHVFANYLILIVVMRMLWAHYKTMLKWRIHYLSRIRPGDAGHTVLLRDIPGTPQGTIIGRIYDNIDSTLGHILPKKFKDKVERAMSEGIESVFGKVKKVDLTGAPELFEDKKMEVYKVSPEGEAYGEPVSFYDAKSRRGSFFSTDGSTPRSISGGGNFVSAQSHFPGSVGGGEGARTGSPLPSVSAPNLPPSDELSGPQPPDTITARRNLRNWQSRPAPTDFETWRQAESALREGITVKQLVEREFERSLGLGHVRAVSVVRNELKLGSLVAKYDQLKLRIEDTIDSWTSSLRRKKKVARKEVTLRPKTDAEKVRWGSERQRVDELELRVWRLEDLRRQILEEQGRVQSKETSAAFVTMSSRLAASTVALGMVSYDESLWQTDPAPSAPEVIWSNISYRGWERSLRALIVWGLFALLVVFMLPIIAFIQSIVNIEAYADQSAFVRWILDAPILGAVLQGILPTLALKIFLILVPIVLRLWARFIGGAPAESAVDFDVGRKYFLFQVLIVFVFVTIIGAMLQGSSESADSDNAIVALIKALGDDPAQIPTWLGTALPQQASFYVMYILTNGVFAKGIAFLRLPGAVIYLLLTRISGTARQKKRCWSQQHMTYGDDVSEHTITILLAIVFAVVQPFVVLVAVIYFFVNYFYATYSLLYVQRERFQTGGLFWPVIFDQIYTGMLIWVISNTALFAVRKFVAGTIAMIPLIVLVLIFRFAVRATFDRPMHMISIHAAADLDRADQKFDWMRETTAREEAEMKAAGWDLEETRLGPVEERYMQPSLAFDEAAHTQALGDAQDIAQRVDQFNAGAHHVVDEEIMLDRTDSVASDADTTKSLANNGRNGSLAEPFMAVGNVPQAHVGTAR